MKILVVGDSYHGVEAFRAGLMPLVERHQLEFAEVRPEVGFQPRDDSERRLLEYEGNPDQVVAALTDHEVLVVHGAPVSRGVLQASARLRMVCCARGGPVNVDVEVAEQLGIRVATTPGKNAPAVADLTLALAVMLARQVQPATAHLRRGGRLVSTFDGAQFVGSELAGMRLGLLGFGRVGTEVCSRARCFGMEVSACDPFVDDAAIAAHGARCVDLQELASGSEVVSLHVRQTPETRRMITEQVLGSFRAGAHLINTAREGIIDEDAVLRSLRSGHLGGVAVDVFHHDGPIARAVASGEDRIIALPHIGGATHQTIRRACRVIVGHIEQLEDGREPAPVA